MSMCHAETLPSDGRFDDDDREPPAVALPFAGPASTVCCGPGTDRSGDGAGPGGDQMAAMTAT